MRRTGVTMAPAPFRISNHSRIGTINFAPVRGENTVDVKGTCEGRCPFLLHSFGITRNSS
ncbi:MAG: hypothetical protein V4613_05505 [Bacteroidota bacterium]